ncbi:MAG: hypothetical protein HQM14_06470 [SAR324 cluster bacterium]|nr:hypothetical protein [SAR324 cluster bacterium]
MKESAMFILYGIRKGKRRDKDFFVTIHQQDGFSATISRQRNDRITIHYQDAGYLTFDPQHVDSFDMLKIEDLKKLHILEVPVVVRGFSGEMPSELQSEVKDGVVNFGGFLRGCLGLHISKSPSSHAYQWFVDLLDSQTGQEFLHQHMATIRYFHGDFDPLKEYLLAEDASTDEETSIFEDPSEPEESFFEKDEGVDFET